MDKAKLLLHDELCEKQVLGVLLSYNSYYYGVFGDYCTEEAFSNPFNRYIFQCIGGVISEGKEPDITSVFEYTQKNPRKGVSEEENSLLAGNIAELISSVVTSATFELADRKSVV